MTDQLNTMSQLQNREDRKDANLALTNIVRLPIGPKIIGIIVVGSRCQGTYPGSPVKATFESPSKSRTYNTTCCTVGHCYRPNCLCGVYASTERAKKGEYWN